MNKMFVPDAPHWGLHDDPMAELRAEIQHMGTLVDQMTAKVDALVEAFEPETRRTFKMRTLEVIRGGRR